MRSYSGNEKLLKKFWYKTIRIVEAKKEKVMGYYIIKLQEKVEPIVQMNCEKWMPRVYKITEYVEEDGSVSNSRTTLEWEKKYDMPQCRGEWSESRALNLAVTQRVKLEATQ